MDNIGRSGHQVWSWQSHPKRFNHPRRSLVSYGMWGAASSDRFNISSYMFLQYLWDYLEAVLSCRLSLKSTPLIMKILSFHGTIIHFPQKRSIFGRSWAELPSFWMVTLVTSPWNLMNSPWNPRKPETAAGEDGLLRRQRLGRHRPLAHRFGGHGHAQAEVGGAEVGTGLVGWERCQIGRTERGFWGVGVLCLLISF